MTQKEIDQFKEAYKVLMGEVSARNLVMRKVYTEAHTTKSNGISGMRLSDIELVYLQIRKTLEIIAFGSLLLNEDAMKKVRNNIEKWWNAKNIMQELEGIHKNFYPVPITNDILETIQNVMPIMKLEEGTPEPYLAKEDLRDLYDIASSWIHAQNPLKGSQYELTEDEFKTELSTINDYAEKISNLLSLHKLQSLNDNGFFIVFIQQIDEPISPSKVQVHTSVTVEYCP